MSSKDWLAIGIAILAAVAAGMWKASNIRSDVSNRWGDRVYVAHAGLSEQASVALRALRKDLNEILVDEKAFDPRMVIKDPASIRAQVKEFLKLMKLRDHLESNYQRLLAIGPWLLVAVACFGIGVAAALGHLVGFWSTGWVAILGWLVMTISGAGCILGFGAYAFLQHQLSVAETLSRAKV